MDKLTPQQRHLVMSHNKCSDTRPEREIRSALFRMGFRFRKNDKRLDGKPDIVLPHYHAVIFVNGCFWHGHSVCGTYKEPKTNTVYWNEKIMKNRIRDTKHIENLLEKGWRVGTVWECSILGKGRKAKLMEVSSQICYWLEEEPHEMVKSF